MAGFLNAALPSDDDSEEDEEYNPLADDTAEKEDRPQGAVPSKGGAKNKRRRGAAIAAAAAKAGGDADGDDDDAGQEEEEEDGDAEADAEAEARDPRVAAKRARVASLWEAINVSAASKGSATEVPPSAAVNLAALCRSGAGGKKAKKADPDAHWMRNLGLLRRPAKPNAAAAAANGAQHEPHGAAAAAKNADGPERSGIPAAAAAAAGPGPSSSGAAAAAEATAEEKRALAAAALSAARDASTAGSRAGKVAVTEVRRFAGKDVQVTIYVDRDSKEAQRAAAKAAAPPPPTSGGLDAILKEIDKKKKVSVLDKTKADWSTYKAANTEVDEELEIYKKSADQYLERQSFLKRAELREYEKERDTRLASDVRTRGRL